MARREPIVLPAPPEIDGEPAEVRAAVVEAIGQGAEALAELVEDGFVQIRNAGITDAIETVEAKGELEAAEALDAEAWWREHRTEEYRATVLLKRAMVEVNKLAWRLRDAQD